MYNRSRDYEDTARIEDLFPMKKFGTTKLLMIYALLIPPVMILLFALMSNKYGRTMGYFLPYGIYLMILLLGVLLFNKKEKGSVQIRSRHTFIYYIISFIPVPATFFAAFLPTLPNIKMSLFIFLLVFALINGTLEELFWRDTFCKIFGEDMMRAYIIPTIIFTCWHFALLFASGVVYQGGWLPLVAGAGVMGAIWGLTMFKTKNVKIVICAHVMVNFFAFSQLLYENWFMN